MASTIEKVTVKLDKDLHKRLKYIELDTDSDNISDALRLVIDKYDKLVKPSK